MNETAMDINKNNYCINEDLKDPSYRQKKS